MGDAAAVQRDFNEGKTRQVADEGDVPEKRDDGTGGQSSNDDEGFIEFQAERAGTVRVRGKAKRKREGTRRSGKFISVMARWHNRCEFASL